MRIKKGEGLREWEKGRFSDRETWTWEETVLWVPLPQQRRRWCFPFPSSPRKEFKGTIDKAWDVLPAVQAPGTGSSLTFEDAVVTGGRMEGSVREVMQWIKHVYLSGVRC